MNTRRSFGVSSKFENNDDLWWITGGDGDPSAGDTTEMYSESAKQFDNGIDLPKSLYFHEMVNLNNTHTVVLGDDTPSSSVYLYDRYFAK